LEIYISIFGQEVTEPIKMGGLAKGLSIQAQNWMQKMYGKLYAGRLRAKTFE